MESSGERLKRAREKAGWKTATAAIKRFGWTSSTYRSHENGQTDPIPTEDAIAYAAAYKTTPQWILFGAGESDAGIDQLLKGQPENVRRRARRMIEVWLEEDE